MAKNISIDDLSSEIVKAVKEYTDDVRRGVSDDVLLTADETRDELKGTSPRRKVNGGEYASGWRVRKTRGANFTQAIVHNKLYQLVHLLEKGHAKRNGGRVRAYPHVFPAEEAAKKRLEERIRRRVEGG